MPEKHPIPTNVGFGNDQIFVRRKDWAELFIACSPWKETLPDDDTNGNDSIWKISLSHFWPRG